MDAYRIGVSIALANGVSPVLAAIGRDMLGLHATVGKIEKGFARWAVAIGATASILGGAAIAGGLAKIAKHGEKLLDQQDQLMRNGIAQNEVLAIQKNYYDNIAKAVPTSTASEYLKTVKELRAVTGSNEEAARLAPKAMKVDSLLSNTFGTESHGEYYKLLRSEEMKGIATNEAKREAFTDEAFAYITAFGGKLKAQDYQTLARRGGAAFINMKPEAMGPMSVLTADLGGDATGTSMMTFHQLMTGANTMTKQQAAAWQEAGLIDMSKTTATGFGGGRLQLGLGALKGSQEHAGDIPGYIKDVIYPALVKASTHDGVLNKAELEQRISKIAPNRNASKMIHMFGEEGFQDQITKDLGLAGKVEPIEKAYENFTTRNPKGVRGGFNQQWESMMEAIGSPLMQSALPIMKSVTEMFTKLGAFANTNPEAIKQIGYVLTGLAAGLVAIGGIALVSLLSLPLAIAGVVTAIGTFAVLNWGAIKSGMDGMENSIKALAGIAWESIKTGVDSIKSAISGLISWLTSIGSAVSDKVKGMFSNPNGPGKGADGYADPKNYMPMRFSPGEKTLKAQPISLSINMDGRTLAQAITEQLEYLTEHATGAPSYNGQSHFGRADGGIMGT